MANDTAVSPSDVSGQTLNGGATIAAGTSLGKLVAAKSYNLFDGNRTTPLSTACTISRASFTDYYTYGGPMGRLSERRLYSENFRYTSSGSTDYFYFKWTYATNPNGQPGGVEYPEAFSNTGNTSLGLAPAGRSLTVTYDDAAIGSPVKMGMAGLHSTDLIQSATYSVGGGLPEEIIYGGGTSGMLYTYDTRNRPQDIYGHTSQGYVLKELSMQYDPSGNLYYFHNADVLTPARGIIRRPCKGCLPIPHCYSLWKNYNASYDELSRIKKYVRQEAVVGINCPPRYVDERDWTYDDFGNITQIATDPATGNPPQDLPTNPADNHLTAAGYDGRGNIQYLENSKIFLYSPGNQMNTYLEEGAFNLLEGQHLYGYDASGRRVVDSKRAIKSLDTGCNTASCWCYTMNPAVPDAVWAQDTIFIRDEAGRVLSEFDRDVSTNGSYSYTWARSNYYFLGLMRAADVNMNPNGNPPTAERRHYFHDHLGSLRAVTDGQDNYLNTMEYWPYGENMYSEGNNEDSYRYTGHERDYDLDLDYMHARHYDYARGRFMSTDPINGAGGWNLYSYVGNNPLNYSDPTGLLPKSDSSTPTDAGQQNSIPPQECHANGCDPTDGGACSCINEHGQREIVTTLSRLKEIAERKANQQRVARRILLRLQDLGFNSPGLLGKIERFILDLPTYGDLNGTAIFPMFAGGGLGLGPTGGLILSPEQGELHFYLGIAGGASGASVSATAGTTSLTTGLNFALNITGPPTFFAGQGGYALEAQDNHFYSEAGSGQGFPLPNASVSGFYIFKTNILDW